MENTTIKMNEDNDSKYLTEEMKEKLKKQQQGQFTESTDDQPLEYFTE